MLFYEANTLCGDMAVRSEILTLGFLMNEINLDKKHTQERTVMVWDPAALRGPIAEGTAVGSFLCTPLRAGFVWVPVCKSLPHCHLLLSYWEHTDLTASYPGLGHGTFCRETMFVIPTAQGSKTLFPSTWLLWSPKDRVAVSRTCFADLGSSGFH